MTLSKNWNNSSYNIPEVGEFNWQSLTTFLADLADNAQTVNFQKFAIRVGTSSPITVSAANDCVLVSNLGTPGPVTVNLPAGVTKQIFMIVDGKGDASTNNITITPNSGNINGASTYVINIDRGGIAVIYNGSEWSIIAEFGNNTSPSSYVPRNKIAAGTAGHVIINDGSGFLSSEAQLASTRGGTGANNAGTLTYGSNNITITTAGASTITIPTTGTLSTLAGAESLSNKTLVSPLVSGGSVDVNAAGALTIGASVGANNLTLGGASSTVQIPGSTVVAGDLTVNGTTTTINTATLDVTDKNVTVSKGGNDVASEGAGLTVDRTGTKGSLIYKDASASKFAIGALGSEVDVADISSTQTLTNKTIGSTNTLTAKDSTFSIVDDSDATKVAKFQASGITTATTRTLTIPDADTTLVGTNATQVITNKDIDGGTASDSLRITLPKNSTTNLNALTRKVGTIVYDTTTSQVKYDDGSNLRAVGSGSGAGEINAILNPSVADTTTGWTNGTSHTLTRVTSGSPLDPVISTALSIAATTTATESATSGEYYSFTMPTALRGRKLKLDFYYTAEASQTWAVSVWKGATRVSLNSDTSGATLLTAGITNKFTANLDSDTSSSYTVNFTRTAGSGTATLIVTNVVIGPDVQPYSAATTDWQIESSVTYTGVGTVSAANAVRRRVGSNLEYRGIFTAGTPTAALFSIALPSNHTLASTSLPVSNTSSNPGPIVGALAGSSGTQSTGTNLVTATGTSTTLVYSGHRINANNALVTPQNGNSLFSTGDVVSWSMSVPIVEYGGGTVNIGQNLEEYAYTTGTWDADSSTTAYGIAGIATGGALTADRTKTITWQKPFQYGDKVVLEVADSAYPSQFTDCQGVFPYVFQNTLGYGARIVQSANNQTQVTFYRYRRSTGATFGAAGEAWGTGVIWRLRKFSAGQAQGFGLLTGDSSGLFPASHSVLDDVAATRIGFKVYSHGTTYNGGSAPTITLSSGGGTLSSVQQGDFIPYQMQDGQWRMKFNIAVSLSSTARTTTVLAVNGILFPATTGNSPNTSVSCWAGTSYVDSAAIQNTNTLEANYPSTSTTRISFSGDLKLNAKPTWAY